MKFTRALALVVLVLALAVSEALAVPKKASAGLIETKVSGLPTSGPSGTSRIVTDGVDGADCTVGGGRFAVLCTFDGSSTWTAGGGGSGGGASTGNHYLTGQDDTGNVPNSINLGALSTGYLKCTTVGSVCTPSTDTTVISSAVPNTYSAGMKQTFNPSATTAGISVGGLAGDPSAGVNGDIVYNASAGKFRCYQAGAWTDCIGGAGSAAFSSVTAGTNTAALVVGTGGSLTVSGTGTINATKLNGTTVSSTNQDANHLLLGDGSWKNCSDGLLLTWASSALACGSVDAATRALDNLASVAINTALLPGTAGSLDFGSATKTWKDLFLAGSSGTPGTNNFKITGTSTSGTRVVTLPDRSITVAGVSGTLTSGNCAKFDASGNIVDNGAVCGGAGSATYSATVTTPVFSNPAASTTYTFTSGTTAAIGSIAAVMLSFPAPMTGHVTAVYYTMIGAGTQGAGGTTSKFLVNNFTQTLASSGCTVSLTAAAATPAGCSETPSLAVTAGDLVNVQVQTQAWTTAPTNTYWRATVLFGS